MKEMMMMMQSDRQTLFDGAFVLADLLNSGGDFPVERAADVEEDERYY